MSGALRGKTVVIAEDDVNLRDILSDELRSLGATVAAAGSGREALSKISALPVVDCLLSDIRMPGGDGIALLRAVKARDREVPVVLMTGFADVTLEQAFDLGAEDVLAKPFNLDVLAATVVRAVTPKARAWTQGGADAAKLSRTIELAFPSLAVAQATGAFRLGRGGVFVAADEPPPENVVVRIRAELEDGPLKSLDCHAVVRWSRSADEEGLRAGYGAELLLVTTPAAGELVALIHDLEVLPYIPRR